MRTLSLPILLLSLCLFLPNQALGSVAEVAVLRQQVQELLKRIDKLEKKSSKEVGQSDPKTLPVKSTDEKASLKIPAKVERARPKNPMSLKISGHVNRGIWYASNGVARNVAHVDNDNSPTRLTIVGSGQWDENTEVGAKIELGIEENSTDEIGVNNVSDNRPGPNTRIVELFVKHKELGELYAGQGSTASDGTMENTDLSKTTLLSAGGSQSFIAGATVFTNAATGANVVPNGENAKPDRVFDPGDGLFRQNRIRYNSPSFLGISVQASHYFAGSNNNWDIAVKYGNTINDVKIKTQAAFMQRNTLTRNAANLGAGATVNAAYNQFNASTGVLLPNGISLFAGWVYRNWFVSDNAGMSYNVRNGTNYTAKVGYQFKCFEAGLTALAVDFGRSTGMLFNVARPQDVYTGTTYGIYAVQFLDRISTELYAGYKHFKMSSNVMPAEEYNDIFAFLFGARVKL